MKIFKLLLAAGFCIFFSENIFSQNILVTDRSQAQSSRYTAKNDLVNKIKDKIELKQGRDNDNEDDDRDKNQIIESDDLNLQKSDSILLNKAKVIKRKTEIKDEDN